MGGHKSTKNEEELSVNGLEEQGRQVGDDDKGDPVDDYSEAVAFSVKNLCVVEIEDRSHRKLEEDNEEHNANECHHV